MRAWTINLKQLDVKRLTGLWRETLLAKKGIEYLQRGEKFAYQNHPQSKIFQHTKEPLKSINTYLWHIFNEACDRGYGFNGDKINLDLVDESIKIPVPKHQVEFEYRHLSNKLNKGVINKGTNDMFIEKEVVWNYEKI